MRPLPPVFGNENAVSILALAKNSHLLLEDSTPTFPMEKKLFTIHLNSLYSVLLKGTVAPIENAVPGPPGVRVACDRLSL